jgi:hypothetical protein
VALTPLPFRQHLPFFFGLYAGGCRQRARAVPFPGVADPEVPPLAPPRRMTASLPTGPFVSLRLDDGRPDVGVQARFSDASVLEHESLVEQHPDGEIPP